MAWKKQGLNLDDRRQGRLKNVPPLRQNYGDLPQLRCKNPKFNP